MTPAIDVRDAYRIFPATGGATVAQGLGSVVAHSAAGLPITLGAPVTLRPMLLGGVFKATEGLYQRFGGVRVRAARTLGELRACLKGEEPWPEVPDPPPESFATERRALEGSAARPLKPHLLTLGLTLLFVDILATLWLAGTLALPGRRAAGAGGRRFTHRAPRHPAPAGA